MIKKRPYGKDLKARLKAAAKDRLYHFTLSGGIIRGAILHATRMINEMRGNHELGILETLVLGHAYMAASLMCATLKGDERIGLKIDCTGPVKGLYVEANAFGEVRGYLKNVPIPMEKPLESFDLVPFFRGGHPVNHQSVPGSETTLYGAGGPPVRQPCQGSGLLLL